MFYLNKAYYSGAITSPDLNYWELYQVAVGLKGGPQIYLFYSGSIIITSRDMSVLFLQCKCFDILYVHGSFDQLSLTHHRSQIDLRLQTFVKVWLSSSSIGINHRHRQCYFLTLHKSKSIHVSFISSCNFALNKTNYTLDPGIHFLIKILNKRL